MSFGLPQPRSSRTLAATIRAIGGEVCSIMMPANVLMAVSVYDRASDSMCPRFFGIFRSLCFVSIRYNPHRRWANQSSRSHAEGGLRVVAPSLDHSTFHRAWGVSCAASLQVGSVVDEPPQPGAA